jgi:hypothetical protein
MVVGRRNTKITHPKHPRDVMDEIVEFMTQGIYSHYEWTYFESIGLAGFEGCCCIKEKW